MAQPGLREPQLSIERRLGDVERGGGLLVSQPAEEAHLEDAAFQAVELAELLQSLIEPQHQLVVVRRDVERFVE